jgi:hypothetical protein
VAAPAQRMETKRRMCRARMMFLCPAEELTPAPAAVRIGP